MLELYIDGVKADLSRDTDISFSYTVTDTENPEAIKNGYSKTVVLPHTAANASIFSHFDKTDFEDGGFSPLERKSFVLLRDGDIQERGYVKLDSVDRKGTVLTYSVTLYSGLGDFFYNLKNKDGGEELSFSDISINLSGETGVLMEWNKEYINASWEALRRTGTPPRLPQYFITAAPTYSGLYDDFSNDRVMINWSDDMGTVCGIPSASTVSSQYNISHSHGYLFGECPRDMSEWEMRDLRSVYQRPAIKASLLLDAISNPSNNGGYTLEWSDSITSSSYWNRGYVILDRLDFEESNENKVNDVYFSSYEEGNYDWVSALYADSTLSSNAFDFSGVSSAMMTVSLTPVISVKGTTKSRIYTSNYNYSYQGGLIFNETGYVGMAIYKMTMTDASGNTLAETPDYITYCDADTMTDYDRDGIASGLTSLGIVTNPVSLDRALYSGSTEDSVTTYSYDKAVRMSIRVPDNTGTVRFRISVKYYYYSIFTNNFFGGYFFSPDGRKNVTPHSVSLSRSEAATDVTGWYIGDSNPSVQQCNVTKKVLFRDFPSPFDFLVSYTKMFNYRYIYDRTAKKIRIVTVDEYYDSATMDLTDKIDLSDMGTTPSATEYAVYRFTQPLPETYAYGLYKARTGDEYGAKDKTTGWQFGSDRDDLFEDGSIQRAIPFKINSVYMNNLSSYYPTVAFARKYNVTYLNSSGDEKTSDIAGYPVREQVTLDRVYDTDARLCLFDKDNGSVDDCKCVFTLFDGWTPYSSPSYLLSDNTEIMYTLNDGSPCYLSSTKTTGVTDNDGTVGTICIREATLPKFLNTYSVGGSVQASIDYEKPDTLFTGSVDYENYDGTKCLYPQYFEDYEDNVLLHSGNRLVRLRVLTSFITDGVQEALRKRYFFAGRWWIINEINDYDPSDNMVEVVFLRLRRKAIFP